MIRQGWKKEIKDLQIEGWLLLVLLRNGQMEIPEATLILYKFYLVFVMFNFSGYQTYY
jgi:hypothetical protein